MEGVEGVEGVDAAHIVFVGDADERFHDDTREAARVLGSRAHFVGKVAEDELPALYNLATVVACPSLIEGFGLPVLEAMACGTPVVCSDIPVFREVASHAALYAPPDNLAAWTEALSKMLGSPAVRANYRRWGLERSHRFSWRAASEALLPAYSQLQR
jgi:glycosyltransferase involved in cell wall biosynthesis